MTEEQLLMVAHLKRLVNTLLRRPVPIRTRDRDRPERIRALARELIASLRASRANMDAGKVADREAAPCGETVCPRCGAYLRRDYDDLVCIPCGYRTPARGNSFTEYGPVPDATAPPPLSRAVAERLEPVEVGS
jgi:hypothetical protein